MAVRKCTGNLDRILKPVVRLARPGLSLNTIPALVSIILSETAMHLNLVYWSAVFHLAMTLSCLKKNSTSSPIAVLRTVMEINHKPRLDQFSRRSCLAYWPVIQAHVHVQPTLSGSGETAVSNKNSGLACFLVCYGERCMHSNQKNVKEKTLLGGLWNISPNVSVGWCTVTLELQMGILMN